jgi:hypothetical protein
VSVPTDFTITTRETIGDQEFQHTLYVQDDRSRDEYTPDDGRRHATIQRCDLNRTFVLDLDANEYESGPLHEFNSRFFRLRVIRFKLLHPIQSWKLSRKSPPTVIVETTTVDTGERKEMFGFTARRVTTMTRRRPLAPPSEESEMTTDGWYIDIDPTIVCERLPRGSRTYLTSHVEGQPPEVPEFKDIGPRETGYPIDLTSDHASQRTLPDGTSQAFRMTLRQQVIHLSTDPIDPQVFEVPRNFLEKSRRR